MVKFFRAIWLNAIVKELVLLVVTAVAIVILVSLQQLSTLLEDGVTLTEVKVWFQALVGAVFLTAIKQAVAWAISRLAKLNLGVPPTQP